MAESAEHVAREYSDHEEQVRSLARFSQSLTEVAELDNARRCIEAAERAARLVKDHNARSWALFTVFRRYIRLNDYSRAEQIFRQILDEGESDAYDVMNDMAQMLADAGELERVRKILQDFQSTGNNSIHLDDLSQILEDLEQTPESAPEGRERSIDDIVRHARNKTDPGERAWALVHLANELKEGGAPERIRTLASDAERSVHDIPDDRTKVGVLASLVLLSRDPEHAERLAETAERVAHRIPYLHVRASALTELAMAVGPPDASRLLGEALVIATWYEPFRALAKHYPRVVVRFADILLAEVSSGALQASS
jgi:tetratricopeptide (TPR) repeat protein